MSSVGSPTEKYDIVRGLIAGMGAHLFAAAVFFALAALELDGCDRGDSLAGAWGMAVIVDFLAILVALAVATHWMTRGVKWVILGWVSSLVVPIALSVIAVRYINGIETGCPV